MRLKDNNDKQDTLQNFLNCTDVKKQTSFIEKVYIRHDSKNETFKDILESENIDFI